MGIIKHSKKFFTIGIILTVASIAAISIFGIPLGIQFTGGTAIELSFEDRPEATVIENSLEQFGFADRATIRPTGQNNYFIRTPYISKSGTSTRSQLIGSIKQSVKGEVTVTQVSSIGPTVGSSLAKKAIIALAVVLLAIVAYIAFIFRKVSKPVPSWKYGAIAIVAVFQDVITIVGLFAVLGAVAGVYVDVMFVIALLTILGYSVNDTIVVFDRTRENLRINQEENNHEEFAHVVGRSLSETLVRSMMTGVSVLLVLAALMVFGAASTFYFALALLVGIIMGTYSSLFLASPLLVQAKRWQDQKAD